MGTEYDTALGKSLPMPAIAARIRTAASEDFSAIVDLLTSFNLPTAGLSSRLDGFLVAENHRAEIVASAGVEIYGSSALLRSVAVRADYQQQGLARDLVQRLLAQVQRAGVRRVYLLTESAAGYFQRLGFESITRDDVEEAVRKSAEFLGACCESAAVMVRDFGGHPHRG